MTLSWLSICDVLYVLVRAIVECDSLLTLPVIKALTKNTLTGTRKTPHRHITNILTSELKCNVSKHTLWFRSVDTL